MDLDPERNETKDSGTEVQFHQHEYRITQRRKVE